MSKATQLDREVSVGDRPQRPAKLPPGVPDSPILPDPPSEGVQGQHPPDTAPDRDPRRDK